MWESQKSFSLYSAAVKEPIVAEKGLLGQAAATAPAASWDSLCLKRPAEPSISRAKQS